ncbi:hypothetical protein [Acetobacter cibinongensis]|nr:hypothetical protein [Acetobacter cibinongensis]
MRLARTSVLFLLIGGAIGAPLLSLSTHTAPPDRPDARRIVLTAPVAND